MLLTCDAVMAGTVTVRFNNAGSRYSVARGAGAPRSAATFGRNAAFTPANRRAAGVRMRQIKYQKAMINAMNNGAIASGGCGYGGYGGYGSYVQNANTPMTTSNEISRFNKNYTIKAPKSYTRGGVTYYN